MKTLVGRVLSCVAIFAFTTPVLAADGQNVVAPSTLSSSNADGPADGNAGR